MALFVMLLTSCSNLPPPTEKKPFRPLNKMKNYTAIDTIEGVAFAGAIPGRRRSNDYISRAAYMELYRRAKEKYQYNVDIADITWVSVRYHRDRLSTEVYAIGQVIVDNQLIKIENTLLRAAKEATKNTPKNSVLSIVSVSAHDRSTAIYIVNELELILINEGFILSDRLRLNLIKQEQNFQLSGEVDDESAVGIGKILGANFVVSAEITGLGNLRRLRIRLIDTETGQVAGVASEQIR